MTKFIFSLFLMFLILNYSNAQNKSIEDFYMYLNQVLEEKEIEFKLF
jgi:hypothetical protein